MKNRNARLEAVHDLAEKVSQHRSRTARGPLKADADAHQRNGKDLWRQSRRKVQGLMVFQDLSSAVARAHELNQIDDAVEELRLRKNGRMAAALQQQTDSLVGRKQLQRAVHTTYNAPRCQGAIAVLIVLNFVVNVAEKELDPQGTKLPGLWKPLEHAFNALFLVELLVNMCAHWCTPFFVSSWNLFDLVVVSIGCMGFFIDFDGPLKLLRTLRAFRVFRLFRRIESLNKILVMIASAIPGVLNAFLVIVLAISIYAMVAVEFFSTFAVAPAYDDNSNETSSDLLPCAYRNAISDELVRADTSRQLCHGTEYFGTFSRAWFSLFQVLTGDSWAEAQARPLLFGWDEYGVSASAFITVTFYTSFVVLNTFILMNVFVAVLLDKVMTPDPPPDWTGILERLEHEHDEAQRDDQGDDQGDEADMEAESGYEGGQAGGAEADGGDGSLQMADVGVAGNSKVGDGTSESANDSTPHATSMSSRRASDTSWAARLSRSATRPESPSRDSTKNELSKPKDASEIGPMVAALLARSRSEKAAAELMASKERSKERATIEPTVEALAAEQRRMRADFDTQMATMMESLHRIEALVGATAEEVASRKHETSPATPQRLPKHAGTPADAPYHA